MRKTKLAYATVILAMYAFAGGLCAAEPGRPEIKPGEKAVVIADAPLQVESKTLATIPPGTELVAEAVERDWIWAAVPQDGKTIKGWVAVQCLVANPHVHFGGLFSHHVSEARFNALLMPNTEAVDEKDYGKLTVSKFQRKEVGGEYPNAKREPALARSAEVAVKLMDRDGDGYVSEQEFAHQPAEVLFLRLDADGSGDLSSEEFVAAARRPTLDDLNRQLRAFASRDVLFGVPTPGTGVFLTAIIRDFEGWRRQPTFDQCLEITNDFVKGSDVRRSPLAWKFADHEAPQARAQRAQALFRWADKNRDGKLTLEEFKQALPQERQRNE
jgi:hypothetical protein